MKGDFKIDSRMAAEVCGLTLGRLNEFISDGIYPCAPATTNRAKRRFDLDEAFNLFIFAELYRLGLKFRNAGQLVEPIARKIAANRWSTTLIVPMCGDARPVVYTEQEFSALLLTDARRARGFGQWLILLDGLRAAFLWRLAAQNMSYEFRAAYINAAGEWQRRTEAARAEYERMQAEPSVATRNGVAAPADLVH